MKAAAALVMAYALLGVLPTSGPDDMIVGSSIKEVSEVLPTSGPDDMIVGSGKQKANEVLPALGPDDMIIGSSI